MTQKIFQNSLETKIAKNSGEKHPNSTNFNRQTGETGKRTGGKCEPSENLEELYDLPSADQPRVALIEIVKQLNQINKTLKQLCQILENTISVEVYRGEVLE
jgi:hypothetical protein